MYQHNIELHAPASCRKYSVYTYRALLAILYLLKSVI